MYRRQAARANQCPHLALRHAEQHSHFAEAQQQRVEMSGGIAASARGWLRSLVGARQRSFLIEGYQECRSNGPLYFWPPISTERLIPRFQT